MTYLELVRVASVGRPRGVAALILIAPPGRARRAPVAKRQGGGAACVLFSGGQLTHGKVTRALFWDTLLAGLCPLSHKRADVVDETHILRA